MQLGQAQTIAEALKEELNPFCDRIEIGGSIRRKKPEVGDIELVCIPKFAEIGTGQGTLFGGEVKKPSNLLFKELCRSCNIEKIGDKYAQIGIVVDYEVDKEEYIKVDVFTATESTWGYIFLLRTGPAEFSKWVVTELKRRGFTPKDGAIWLGGEQVPTIDEIVVFQHLLIDYIQPECRFKAVMWK